MKIAILTMFNGFSSTYSLVNVVAEQLSMILNYSNFDVTVFVSETCNMKERFGIFLDENVKYKKIVNSVNGEVMNWVDYDYCDELADNFFYEVEIIKNDFVNKLEGYDVCLMHDILYQGTHLLHNVAIRKAQDELPNLRFVSFTHSMPLEYEELEYPFNMRFCDMPNTVFAYPTSSGLKALSEQFQIDINRCRTVSNTIPTIEDMNCVVQNLQEKTNFLDNDILVVYPARLTSAKKFDIIAKLCGSLKTVNNKKVKIIYCDFESDDVDPNEYKKWVVDEGKRFGLDDRDIIFTSDYGYKNGINRNAVLDLFKLSSLFICPSFAESFGLTILEAGLNGNFLVLNESQPALKEVGESLNAYFMKWDAKNFGYETLEEYYPNEKAYYDEHAKIIYQKMIENNILKTKQNILKRYSNKYVWENQLKPIMLNKILI